MALSEQTFWLIERSDLAPYPLYMRHTARGHAWTPDHDEAVRFATAEEASAECCGGDANGPLRVAEHKWLGSALLDAARAEHKEEPGEICWRCRGERCIQEGSPEAWNYADCPECNATGRIPPRAEQPVMSREAELTADFMRSLPGGTLDDSEYEKIEDALDRLDAPMQDDKGRWLKLHERVAALASPGGGEEFLEFKEALSDLRSLRHEYDCLNGGGPGWSQRNAAAWKRADELFADEDEAAYQRQQEDAHG